MLIKILVCLWLPIVLFILCIMNILKPFKMKGALTIKGSRKNENTWNFSQKFYSVFLLILSIFLLAIAIIYLTKTIDNKLSLRSASTYIGLISLVGILIPIPFTKLALVKRFDKEGNYRKS